MINRYRLTSTVYEREDESQKVLPEKRIFLSVEGNATEKEYFDGVSKYREKIGIEETKEVLTTYLHRKDRNLNRLIRYAEMLKCGDIMKKYLQVLV